MRLPQAAGSHCQSIRCLDTGTWGLDGDAGGGQPGPGATDTGGEGPCDSLALWTHSHPQCSMGPCARPQPPQMTSQETFPGVHVTASHKPIC